MQSPAIKFLLKSVLILLMVSQIAYIYAASCGDYITRNITLTSDLDCSSGYVALTISASNITIDLNGHTLSGVSRLQGISIHNYDNLTIKNGQISGFWAGINSTLSDNLNVENIVFSDVGAGVIVSGGNKALIKKNKFIKTTSVAVNLSSNTDGHTSNNHIIDDNEFYRTRGGVRLCGGIATNNRITNNLFWKTELNYGIHLNQARYNTVSNNRILETGDIAAIRLNNSSYNEISGNTLMKGESNGISILANAGAPCSETSVYGTSQWSGKNQIIDNQISDFSTHIVLGLGESSFYPYPIVGNNISGNQFNNAGTAIFLNTDTQYNYGRANNFSSVIERISDLGYRNSY